MLGLFAAQWSLSKISSELVEILNGKPLNYLGAVSFPMEYR